MAQDPVKVDSKHYTVEFENDQVRVLRAKYAPGEKSVMHGHPASVAVFITDHHGRFTYPDGKTEEITGKAGQALFIDPMEHLPENIGSQTLEVLVIELKH
jgi:quercetin dioxygenase-like cupin family protein